MSVRIHGRVLVNLWGEHPGSLAFIESRQRVLFHTDDPLGAPRRRLDRFGQREIHERLGLPPVEGLYSR
ncbi:MAG: hypothetical protein JW818_13390 [Pirellulales bacterium]|nr:hypothetical protein [Pirellulales bacterium]